MTNKCNSGNEHCFHPSLSNRPQWDEHCINIKAELVCCLCDATVVREFVARATDNGEAKP